MTQANNITKLNDLLREFRDELFVGSDATSDAILAQIDELTPVEPGDLSDPLLVLFGTLILWMMRRAAPG